MLALAAVLGADGCSTIRSRQYEYEEELNLSLDGSAVLYVNSSVAALVALRGLDLNVDPRARLDRDVIRDLYTSPVARVSRVTGSRRHGRRFVHLRIEVQDVARLTESPPFSWSSYELVRDDEEVVFRQHVGASVGRDVGSVGWTGRELVAFRLHLPSKVRYHNAPSRRIERGNIASWEQPLVERLKGRPLSLEVRLDPRTILYRTLWLFGLMLVLVVLSFVLVIWLVTRKGRHSSSPAGA
jgi:preprotein translocase subunit Sec61beta